jgi:hypothetical protein
VLTQDILWPATFQCDALHAFTSLWLRYLLIAASSRYGPADAKPRDTELQYKYGLLVDGNSNQWRALRVFTSGSLIFR